MRRPLRSRVGFERIVTRTRREVKHARLRLWPAPPADHPLLHVIGCQRSGTTMLTQLLDRDPAVRVHGELEDLFEDVPRHHRMKDAADVRRRLQRSGAALDVVKPLVESHRCAELLQLQDRAVALWMFRHYSDVASSNLRRFGLDNGHRNLRAIVDDAPGDWRNAGISPGLRATVRELASNDLTPHDAAALFWYCRNTLFAEQRLDADPRVRTCRYEDLVADPRSVLAALYAWVGLPDPAVAAVDMVHDRSVGKGSALELSSPVRLLCDTMWRDLLEADRTCRLMARGRA